MCANELYDADQDRRFRDIRRYSESTGTNQFSMLDTHFELLDLACYAEDPSNIDSVLECTRVIRHLWELIDECPYIEISCAIGSDQHITSAHADFPFFNIQYRSTYRSLLATPIAFDIKQHYEYGEITLVPVLVSEIGSPEEPSFLFTALKHCDIHVAIPDLN